MTFGPEYPKIQTIFKRDPNRRNVVIPGVWSTPEFAYLSDSPWEWTEKVDGTNIRVHWNGEVVTIGGRTDNAQVPTFLIAALQPLTDIGLWRGVFPNAADVTVYGEGYGAKIQKGGQYRQDQALVVFDVKVGSWWLQREDVEDVAKNLGLETVPTVGTFTLFDAWGRTQQGSYTSAWPDAQVEGLVGRPLVDLFDRKGDRIIAKVKVKDARDYERSSK